MWLYFSFTLPHVVLLHSVTSLQYKGSNLVESDLHLVFLPHYHFPYSAITLSCWHLHRASSLLLTHYIQPYSPLQPSPFTLPYSQVVLPAQTH